MITAVVCGCDSYSVVGSGRLGSVRSRKLSGFSVVRAASNVGFPATAAAWRKVVSRIRGGLPVFWNSSNPLSIALTQVGLP